MIKKIIQWRDKRQQVKRVQHYNTLFDRGFRFAANQILSGKHTVGSLWVVARHYEGWYGDGVRHAIQKAIKLGIEDDRKDFS